MADDVAQSHARIAELEMQVRSLQAQSASFPASSDASRPPAAVRSPITQLSAEVVESNPYSRLMALQQMGVLRDYAAIRHHTVLIVGLGGVGSVVAEMLTRCGVGRLLLLDRDTVQLANMNRLFFLPHQVGLRKVDAAVCTLRQISPDTAVTALHCDVTAVSDYPLLLSAMATGSVTSPAAPVSLVLSCVDSYAARLSVNSACLSLRQTWMDAGVSEDAMSGRVQTLVPGRTACFQCAPPLVLEQDDAVEADIVRPGTCAASLPTTTALVAALLAHNALRLLLGFGRVSLCQGWGGLRDDWPQWRLACNSECSSADCRQRQREWEGKQGLEEEWDEQEKLREKQKAEERRQQRQHDSNEWGIQLVEQSSDSGAAPAPAAASTVSGRTDRPAAAASADDAQVTDLLSQLRAVQRQDGDG